MAVTRQFNWLGQQRVDGPHLRLLEVAVAYDFDVLAGIAIAGRKALVVSGFEMITTGAAGNDAENLIMIVAGSTAYNFEATESGSVFHVPDDRDNETLSPTNPRVEGAFVPNTTNFVGMDFVRSADDTTVDNVAFLNPVSNEEIFETVPLARTIDYKIVISTTEFSATPGVVPVAIVVTDTSNKVVTVTDARPLMYGLNDPYSWPQGRGATGGDVAIQDQKSWQDAVMTRIWEVGGGEYWYSPTDYRNVRLVGSGAVMVSTGEYWEVIANNVHWQNLSVIFDNSTAFINEIADQTVDQNGLTNLGDGECIFVDLDRYQDRTGVDALVAQKADLVTLGQSAIPGQRYVICWRSGDNFYVRDQPYSIGGSLKIATTMAYGTVKISSNPDLGIWDAASPVVPVIAMVAGAGYTATAGGISHNADGGVFGTFDTILPPGDIVIGRGSTAGDENIELFTSDSIFQTHVLGYGEQNIGGGGTSVLDIDSEADQLSQEGRQRNRITTQRGLATVGSNKRAVHFVETDGAVGQAVTTTTPATAELTDVERVRAKYFLQPSKRWLAPVDYATTLALDACTAAGTGVGKTLTADVAGFLVIDGLTVGINDRVLIKNEADGFNNGIYDCTIEGDGITAWELTRATDADENQEVVHGIAVLVEAGNDNADTYWMLNTLDALQADRAPQVWAADLPTNFLVRKSDCICATTVPLPANTAVGLGVGKTLTANANGALFVDLEDLSPFAGEFVLVKDEANPVDNGLYVITDGGSAGTPWILTRASFADELREVCTGMGVFVFSGSVNNNTYWKLTTPNEIIVDSTDLVFGITTLETRDQRCVRWWDGSVDVLQESPAYSPIFEPTFYTPVS